MSNDSVDAINAAAGLRAVPTPDPGRRITRHGLWDESMRPVAPTDPDTVYSQRGQLTASMLVEVHDMLRAELAELRAALAKVERGESSAADARSLVQGLTMSQHDWSVGAYCARYCRLVTHHHSIETSMVFPHLRSADPELAPVVDRLQEEHVVIHGVIESVDRALVAFMNDEADVVPVREAVDVLTDTLVSHLSYEEHQLIEPLARFGFMPGQV